MVTMPVEAAGATRMKRVINGSPYLDIEKSDYLSLRYFVWISNGHNCDVPVPDVIKDQINLNKDYEWNFGLDVFFYWWGSVCAPRYNHLRCTGSLLTPRLVQTACHCVVHFYVHQSTTGRAVALNAAEEKFSVHTATRFVENLPEGVYSKDFVVHPKCNNDNIDKFTKQQGAFSNLKYDYALMILEHPVTPIHGVFAPLYRVADLAKIWTGIMSKRKMCLNIGFGNFRKLNEVLEKSEYLRHGWVTTLDYLSCERMQIYTKHYNEEVTWFCTDKLGPVSFSSGKGDSGGPVTCDNEYAGIVCEGTEDYNKQMSTAFTVYENAYEYREELSYRIYQIYGSDDALNNYRVTSEPFYNLQFSLFLQGNSTSTGSSTINNNILYGFYGLILSSIIG
ncbi:hypothetical protein GE061_005087 [Apolygus lucorum]|uniref:Uncharacterized protein n=1 Tax=Apolygus lucorum TaxID=248454 RepID=A0A6A4J477_APOLU|nr:hypothetical protein GE061_005087 [Apolygus lucorum]